MSSHKPSFSLIAAFVVLAVGVIVAAEFTARSANAKIKDRLGQIRNETAREQEAARAQSAAILARAGAGPEDILLFTIDGTVYWGFVVCQSVESANGEPVVCAVNTGSGSRYVSDDDAHYLVRVVKSGDDDYRDISASVIVRQMALALDSDSRSINAQLFFSLPPAKTHPVPPAP